MLFNMRAQCVARRVLVASAILTVTACGTPQDTAALATVQAASEVSEDDPFMPPPLPEAECNEVSAAMPYESHTVHVLGSTMHYLDEGHEDGEVMLFLHGNPTSSYSFRNVIPHVLRALPDVRVIAPDAIGMGKSGKPDIEYTFDEHVAYLSAFIDKLHLEHITLVVHDWGSGWGLTYASRHPHNVRAVAMWESMVAPRFPAIANELPANLAGFFAMLRDPVQGPELVIDQNFFIEGALPGFTLCDISPAAHDVYRQPYLQASSRQVLLSAPLAVPIDGEPANVASAMSHYNEWLLESSLPKLVMYADPGALIGSSEAAWLEAHWSNVSVVNIGPGLHYLQETNPDALGITLAAWYADQVPES